MSSVVMREILSSGGQTKSANRFRLAPPTEGTDKRMALQSCPPGGIVCSLTVVETRDTRGSAGTKRRRPVVKLDGANRAVRINNRGSQRQACRSGQNHSIARIGDAGNRRSIEARHAHGPGHARGLADGMKQAAVGK